MKNVYMWLKHVQNTHNKIATKISFEISRTSNNSYQDHVMKIAQIYRKTKHIQQLHLLSQKAFSLKIPHEPLKYYALCFTTKEIYLSKKVYMIKGKYWDLIIFHTTFVIIEYGGQAFMFELYLNVIYLQIQVIYSWI